jgi:murein DD-endopeptidase MepM/ murein hydrolase activator NlpD
MKEHFTRRTLLAAGTAALVAGCSTRSDSAYHRDVNADGVWYVVCPGDTLSSLQRRTGVGVQAIIEANALTSPRLVTNARLWIPGATVVNVDPLNPAEAAAAATAEVPAATTNEDVNDHELFPVPPNGRYVLVPRSAWTSQGVARNNRLMDGVGRLTVHHTGEEGAWSSLPDIEVIRRIERYHRNVRHWAAIGYHYIVGRDAKIYEGRPVRYQGSHVLTGNQHNIGISVIGDFQNHMPNDRQLAALRAFLDDERDRYHVSKSHVYGHRDLHPSICPGDALYAWLVSNYKRNA